MKERPIIFSPESVRAILNGRKTQTRRLMKVYSTHCPYGAAGDRLWIRQTFAVPVYYPVESTYAEFGEPILWPPPVPPYDSADKYWKRPAIYMPRNISPATLEILNIRAERLCEITTEDIRAEGFVAYRDFIETFGKLYPSLHRGDGYDPFVWVVEFRRVEP